jgi:hypothetical protein
MPNFVFSLMNDITYFYIAVVSMLVFEYMKEIEIQSILKLIWVPRS